MGIRYSSSLAPAELAVCISKPLKQSSSRKELLYLILSVFLKEVTPRLGQSNRIPQHTIKLQTKDY
jgi:hypothetical protein